ncbi:unnamed protein product [Boreogadus saida]
MCTSRFHIGYRRCSSLEQATQHWTEPSLRDTMSNYYRGWDRAEPKYRGLRNQGSTDYLNSVLQVLFMTKEFRDAVQSESSHTSYIDAHLKDLFLLLKTVSPTTEYIICKLGIENVWKQQDAAQYFDKILSLASPEASQVFHGRLIHRTSCSCGVSTDEHNSFWTLNLPINNAHTGVYNVEDGLKQFFSQSKLTGENQVYCDECEVKADTTTECEVELYPKVLVLLLKRFEFCYYEMDYVKNNTPLDVPLNIDIPKGVSYELYATVDHVGDLRGGHYTATIQPPDDGGSWYDFDDSRVTPKNNFNPERSQNGYLLFYRKRERQMSDSPQEHPHGSSVDPVESETILNNADDGVERDDDVRAGVDCSEGGEVTRDDDVRAGVDVPECGEVTRYDDVRGGFHVPECGEVTRYDDVRGGFHVPECGEVTRYDDVRGGFHVPECGEVTRYDDFRGGFHVPECGEVTGGDEVTEGVDLSERGEVTGGDEVTEGVDLSERGEVTGGDEVTEGVDLTKRGDVERDDDVRAGVDVPECGEVTGGDDVRAGVDVPERGEVTGGDDVRAGVDVPERGEVTGGDVVAGDPQTLESARLDGKGGERIKRDEELPTNEMDSRKPGDQAGQQEASGTAPTVSDPEGRDSERRRGRRESMKLFEVFGEGQTEGGVIQKKGREVFDIPNCFSEMCLAKRRQRLGSKVDMVKDKKSIKKRRKKNGFICINKETSDTE